MSVADTLAGKLANVVRDHYPEGDVDYVEVIRAGMALATAYQRALEKLSPNAADEIRKNVEAIALWMASDVVKSAFSRP